jgi:hypothetical protein
MTRDELRQLVEQVRRRQTELEDLEVRRAWRRDPEPTP